MGSLSLVRQPPLPHLVESIWDRKGARQPHRLGRVLPGVNAGLITDLDEVETRGYDERRRCRHYRGMTVDGPGSTGTVSGEGNGHIAQDRLRKSTRPPPFGQGC